MCNSAHGEPAHVTPLTRSHQERTISIVDASIIDMSAARQPAVGALDEECTMITARTTTASGTEIAAAPYAAEIGRAHV